MAQYGPGPSDARRAHRVLGFLLVLALAAHLASGCTSTVPVYTLGSYRAASDHALFERVIRALLDEGHVIEVADERAGRIEVRTRWHREARRSVFILHLVRPGWIVVQMEGPRVSRHADTLEMHPAMAASYDELVVRLRTRLAMPVEQDGAFSSSLTAEAWASAEGSPTASVNPRFSRSPSARVIGGALVPLVLGWAGSIGIAAGVHGSSTLSSSGGAQDYANEHFVPLLGSFVGLARATGCADLNVGHMLLDVATGVVQLAGTIMMIIGITVGDRVISLDGPLELELGVLPWASQEGAGLVLGGTL